MSYCPDGRPHYWLLEDADGPTSVGRCCNCDEERVFRNSQPENISADWIDRQRQRSRQRWDKVGKETE